MRYAAATPQARGKPHCRPRTLPSGPGSTTLDCVDGKSRRRQVRGRASGWQRWQSGLVGVTERYLSWRRRRRIRRKIRQQRKNPILDWAEAIGSAILIVLLINQFLLQAYRIPSESMVPTLLVGDRIFVNKVIFGPELVPGAVKLPSPRTPRRGEVIIFENPTYAPVGPLMDLLQRVIYMATLSIVNIDTDEQGRPRAHFLIKRAIGMPGDRIRLQDGSIEIKVGGAGPWIPERELMQQLGLPYSVSRLFPEQSYPDLRRTAVARVRAAAGMAVSAADRAAVERIRQCAGSTTATRTPGSCARATSSILTTTRWDATGAACSMACWFPPTPSCRWATTATTRATAATSARCRCARCSAAGCFTTGLRRAGARYADAYVEAIR